MNKRKNLEIASTSTVTGAITTQTVNLSSIAYDDLSGLDKFAIKGGKTV